MGILPNCEKPVPGPLRTRRASVAVACADPGIGVAANKVGVLVTKKKETISKKKMMAKI